MYKFVSNFKRLNFLINPSNSSVKQYMLYENFFHSPWSFVTPPKALRHFRRDQQRDRSPVKLVNQTLPLTIGDNPYALHQHRRQNNPLEEPRLFEIGS